MGVGGTADDAEKAGAPSRRQLLKGVAALGAAASFSSGGLLPDQDRDGLSDYVEEDELTRYIEDLYGETVTFDPETPNLIIDARYVEGEQFPERYKQQIVEEFADHDITALWLDYPEAYPRDRFNEQYGYIAEDILGGWWRPVAGFLSWLDPRPTPDIDRNGVFGSTPTLYEEWVEEPLKHTALQLFFVPGKADEPEQGHLYSEIANSYKTELDQWAGGVSFVNRAVVGNPGNDYDRFVITFHEIGHIGACHDHHDPTNRGLMGQNEEAEFTPREWGQIRRSIQYVRHSDIGLLFDACWRHLRG